MPITLKSYKWISTRNISGLEHHDDAFRIAWTNSSDIKNADDDEQRQNRHGNDPNQRGRNGSDLSAKNQAAQQRYPCNHHRVQHDRAEGRDLEECRIEYVGPTLKPIAPLQLFVPRIQPVR